MKRGRHQAADNPHWDSSVANFVSGEINYPASLRASRACARNTVYYGSVASGSVPADPSVSTVRKDRGQGDDFTRGRLPAARIYCILRLAEGERLFFWRAIYLDCLF